MQLSPGLCCGLRELASPSPLFPLNRVKNSARSAARSFFVASGRASNQTRAWSFKKNGSNSFCLSALYALAQAYLSKYPSQMSPRSLAFPPNGCISMRAAISEYSGSRSLSASLTSLSDDSLSESPSRMSSWCSESSSSSGW